MKRELPPRTSKATAQEVAGTLRRLAERLERLADAPEGEWGLNVADVGQELAESGGCLIDSGSAVAILEGHSVRAVAGHLGIANSMLPRRLSGTPELAEYAEDTGSGRRVTQGGVARALYDLRHGEYRAGRGPEGVPRRRKRG